MRQLQWCITAFLIAMCSFGATGQGQVDVGNFEDLLAAEQECYDALIAADANFDRKVVADEYVTVIQMLGPDGFMSNATSFVDLPFSIKATFNALACLCGDIGGNSLCCVGDNAHISNAGAAPGETPTPEQYAYLQTVCLTIELSIDQVLASTIPTFAPTMSPTTQAPTIAPTKAPTGAPTGAPTATPTPAPSIAPVATPVPTPAPTSAKLPVQVTYLVQLTSETLTSEEEQDLEAAMNILAPEVANEVFNSKRQVLRRRLEVSVELPTSIFGTTPAPADCPNDGDTCLDVSASVTLLLDGQNVTEAQTKYTKALTQAIDDGRLETALLEVNNETSVKVLGSAEATSPTTPTPAPESSESSEGLSSGATAGIAIAAVATVLAAAGLLVARKRTQEKTDAYYAAGTQALADSDQVARDAADMKESDVVMLGATQADYGKKSKQAAQTSVVAFDTLEVEDEKGMRKPGSGDSSSNAGSSGWSSSAGVSSLNTGSADSLDFAGGAAVGATLAAIGKASAIPRQTQEEEGESGAVPPIPTVSRSDLDAAIEAGDWAAVGATAALLAAASDSPDSRSHSSRSGRTSSSRGGSAVSSIDAARAAELDHLVDAGDWEGVVLAAAKFEAGDEGSKGSSRSPKSGSATESRSLGGSTGAASSGYSPSVTSDSESPSKQQKRAEIRAEVEALVRRVVPEEIDNVDEMMLQFKGREEELVETLRTMQERAVAQKARVQGQKAAKREARNIVQQGGMELPAPPGAAAGGDGGGGLSPAAAVGVAAGAAAAVGIAAGIAAGTKQGGEDGADTVSSGEPLLIHEDSTPSGSISSGSGKRRTALELAIEADDWEAVGEAAAMMSDTSVTTASSGEVRALAEGSFDEEDSDVARMRKAGVNADRAAELDNMIDQGDWTGVVAAASRFSKLDSHTEESSESSASESKQSDLSQGKKRSWLGGSSLLDKKPAAQSMDQAMDEDVERDADQARREEEDALAQAEIWMAIANQSKQEGSTDVGASDAADWAIARSLSALRSAEARGELSQPAKDGSSPPVSSSASIGEGSKGDRSV